MEPQERIETETSRKTPFDRFRKTNSVSSLIERFEKQIVEEESATRSYKAEPKRISCAEDISRGAPTRKGPTETPEDQIRVVESIGRTPSAETVRRIPIEVVEVPAEKTPYQILEEPVRRDQIEIVTIRPITKIPIEVVEVPAEQTPIQILEEPIRRDQIEIVPIRPITKIPIEVVEVPVEQTPIQILDEPIRNDQIEIVTIKEPTKFQENDRLLLEPQGAITFTSDDRDVATFQSKPMETDGLVGLAPGRKGGAFKTRGMRVSAEAAPAAPKNFVDVPDFGYYGIDGSLQTEF